MRGPPPFPGTALVPHTERFSGALLVRKVGSSTDGALGRLSGSDRAVGSVPAVAGLEQRVGREGGELLGPHELVDHVRKPGVVGEVEVVHDLGALVAEVSIALETRRSGHLDLLPTGGHVSA